jgi:choline kinase
MAKLNQNTNNLTVVILAAGFGRRMGQFSRMINKGLIPFDNKPLISHIMGKFPENTNFVIACGHNSQQVKDYVSYIHRDRSVKFVDVPNYEEGTSGPATSIQACAQYIDGGFIWISCDTLFDFDYSDKLDHNWIAVHPVDSNVAQDYCWIERDGNKITAVRNKVKSDQAVDAFIGLMYVKDKQYVENLKSKSAKEVAEGFDGLDLKAYTVKKWQDFGTYDKWKTLSEGLPEVSFPKPNELFYIDNGVVVKFWASSQNAPLMNMRAVLNPACMPGNVRWQGDFLFYDWVQGTTLYNALTPQVFSKFLDWAQDSVWIEGNAKGSENRACYEFYKMKTMVRLENFRIKYNDWSENSVVNGRSVQPIDYYLNKIDFDWLCETHEWCFIHGDMQFDNIIYDADSDKFTAIDWRTDFAGEQTGDLYYDLAKMLGGIYLSYKEIKNHKLEYKETDVVEINLPSVENADMYVNMLRNWVVVNSLDWKKVQILVPLIYLNMSPLHEPPFDKYLIALSQYFFAEVL